MTPAARKAELRTEALARRSRIPDEVRAGLATRLAMVGPSLAKAHRTPSRPVVSAFLPIRDEPDCRPLLQALADAGLGTALPVTPPRGSPLRFHRWRPGEPLVAGPWQIPEPGPGAEECRPDVLFVPLAAFDRTGQRLGYGAGFYDAALAALRAMKPVLAVGVGFALQEVEAVPAEAHDQRLDMIVTETLTHVIAAA